MTVASELPSVADAGPLDELERARLQRLRAKIGLADVRAAMPLQLLLDAARRSEPLDVRARAQTYLEALEATILAGRLAGDCRLSEIVQAARAAPPSAAPDAADLLLDGLAVLFTDGYASAASTLRRAVQAFCSSDEIRGRGLAGHAAAALWEAEAMHTLATSHVGLTRDAGALTRLPPSRSTTSLHVQAGDFATAAHLVEEADAIARATGHVGIAHTALVLAAWRGSEAETSALIEVSRQDTLTRCDGRQLVHTEYAAAILGNGLGRYEGALIAVRNASEREDFFSCWILPELIEAAARSGRRDLAVAACERLVAQTKSATRSGPRIEARSLVLVTDGPNAEKLFREAIDRLGRCPAAAHLARAHLVYGEWLRRQNRRVDAREQLHLADAMFSQMGRDTFASPHASRAACDRRARGGADRRVDQPAHLSRSTDRPPRARRALEPADRGEVLHQRTHGRVPLAQRFHQTRHQLTRPTRRGAQCRYSQRRIRVANPPSSRRGTTSRAPYGPAGAE